MSVREELYKYRADLKREQIDQMVDNGDLLEAAEWNSRNTSISETEFYRNSRMYIWNQVQAEEARIRGGDFARMMRFLPKPISKSQGCKVLDFGCGIGSAGLYLTDDMDACGYVSYFCEICEASKAFLEYRLKNRNMYQRLVHPSEPWRGQFDLVIAYAVFEHMNTDTLGWTLNWIQKCLKESGTLFMVNYHDTFDGRWPMHHTMSEVRKNLFDCFQKERRVVAPPWQEMEGELVQEAKPVPNKKGG